MQSLVNFRNYTKAYINQKITNKDYLISLHTHLELPKNNLQNWLTAARRGILLISPKSPNLHLFQFENPPTLAGYTKHAIDWFFLHLSQLIWILDEPPFA